MDKDYLIRQAAEQIIKNQPAVALTGAGISVESGIPDFRGKNGLWVKYDPSFYAAIDSFYRYPVEVWNMLREMDNLIANARPNPAHVGLGTLEKMGLLRHIVTQNVDNLHQDAGSGNVTEFHGNSSTLTCPFCSAKYTMKEKRQEFPPRCDCGKILKPDIIFFGEAIPEEALDTSLKLAASARTLIVIGTSAQVTPASSIPAIAARNNARIIEINKEETWLTEELTDIYLGGNAGEIIPALVDAAKEMVLK